MSAAVLAMESLSTTTEFDKVKPIERKGPKPTEAEITNQFCIDLLVDHIYQRCEQPAEAQTHHGEIQISSKGEAVPAQAKQAVSVVALQFPDYMLPDSPFIAEILQHKLEAKFESSSKGFKAPRVYILADTSYSPCCVDVVAAQHVSADLIVHFGNACLNPVKDTPVVYIFGKMELDLEKVESQFRKQYNEESNKDDKIIFLYDPEYEHALRGFVEERLRPTYPNIVPTWIEAEDPDNSTMIPARSDVIEQYKDVVRKSRIPVRKYPRQSSGDDLSEYSIFYVMSPNPSSSFLLHLTTLVSEVHLLEAPALDTVTAPHTTLSRRYRYMNMARTAATIGILINTVSLRDVGPALKSVQEWITAASKKYYTFVVGKPNVPKLANFDVIDIWVVLGCPLGGIIVDCEDYYKPIITPYELNLALQPIPMWTGKWLISLQAVLDNMKLEEDEYQDDDDETKEDAEEIDEDAPVFDTITGKYVSTSRPLRRRLEHVDVEPESSSTPSDSTGAAKSLVVKHSSQLVIKNTVSTAADHLYNKLSWSGLGSDFNQQDEQDSEGDDDGQSKKNKGHYATVEKGRGGVARGYKVEEDEDRT